MKVFRLVIAGSMILLTAAISVVNMTPVEVNYLIGSRSTYASVVFFAGFFIGGIIAVLLHIPAFQKLKRENHKLNKRLQQAQKASTIKPNESNRLSLQ